MKTIRAATGLLLWMLLTAVSWGETIPSKPDKYFNDYANVVNRWTAQQLNEEMAQFERSNACQILVAIYPTMDSESDVADYCQRIAQKWGVGQKENNGLVIFAFIKEHRSNIQVGYGLEGKVPDITAKRILDNEMTPDFRKGDYTAGMTKTVHAAILATRGEYKGTGATAAEVGKAGMSLGMMLLLLLAVIVVIVLIATNHGDILIYALCNSSSSSGGSSRSSGGGGSSFSSGGGSFGGGGASGSW